MAILAGVPAAAFVLVRLAELVPSGPQGVRIALASVLVVTDLLWYAYVLFRGWVSFPYGLPLDLCDLAVWLTAAALLTERPLVRELAYYWGLAGSGMALLTPDLGVPVESLGGMYFFASHGLVVASILFLCWSGQLRPRPRSFLSAFGILNIYAAAVGLFNAVFSTNYFYLCDKPTGVSMLDWMGPWPWYILSGEMVAFLLFALLQRARWPSASRNSVRSD